MNIDFSNGYVRGVIAIVILLILLGVSLNEFFKEVEKQSKL